MHVLQFKQWTFRYAARSTELTYHRAQEQEPPLHADVARLNFERAYPTLLPRCVRSLFHTLGIPAAYPFEAWPLGEVGDISTLYTSLHPVVGYLDAGPVTSRYGRITKGCYMRVSRTPMLLPDAFVGLPVFQIELALDVPWMLQPGGPGHIVLS